jgi:hypothetical protein
MRAECAALLYMLLVNCQEGGFGLNIKINWLGFACDGDSIFISLVLKNLLIVCII